MIDWKRHLIDSTRWITNIRHSHVRSSTKKQIFRAELFDQSKWGKVLENSKHRSNPSEKQVKVLMLFCVGFNNETVNSLNP